MAGAWDQPACNPSEARYADRIVESVRLINWGKPTKLLGKVEARTNAFVQGSENSGSKLRCWINKV